MKRILLLLTLLFPAVVMAAGNDLFINQRNADNTATLTRQVTHPTGTLDGLFGYNGATQLPVFLGVGPGLSLTGGVLDATAASAPTWASITGKPTTFPPAAHTQTWSTITATPTTLAGYGITDSATAAQLSAKFNTPTGTTAQYVRGDGSLATLPVAKRIETYAGTTNAAGQIAVTYPTAFPVAPVVQPPAPAAANQVWTTVSSTATGFTLQLNQRNAVTLLAVEVLLGATVPVAGTTATMLVVAQ